MASGARCNRCLEQVLALKAGNEGGILHAERGASGGSAASAAPGQHIQGVQHTQLHDFVGFPGGGLLLSKTQSVFTAHIRDKAGMSPRTVSGVTGM